MRQWLMTATRMDEQHALAGDTTASVHTVRVDGALAASATSADFGEGWI
jgi:hypothetical protein